MKIVKVPSDLGSLGRNKTKKAADAKLQDMFGGGKKPLGLLDEKPEEEKDEGLFSWAGSILTTIGEVWPYILIALIIVIIAYLLLTKAWERKDLEKNAQKWWAVLLGSKKESRTFLSLFFGVSILLILIMYPLVKLSQEDTPKADVSGETQGVQDSIVARGLLLRVLPKATSQGYLIYAEQDSNSKPIYTANDGEEFDVIDETENWYKVVVDNDIQGWIQKSSIKSVTQKKE